MYSSSEILYKFNSILIVSILFFLILLTYEVGYRIGRYFQHRSNSDVKSQTNTILTGTMGLLALLLGFSFNMALQRFDNRSKYVIIEANSIRAAVLRTKLLPAPYDSIAATLLQKYIKLRTDATHIDNTNSEVSYVLNKRTESVQNLIWENAIKAAKKDPNAVTSGYFIVALNNMVDARGTRNAYLQLHVPEVILFLLFVVFIIFGGLMGFSSGLGQSRTLIPTLLIIFLITLVVFIIIDLDRPRRGLIKVNEDSIRELRIKE